MLSSFSKHILHCCLLFSTIFLNEWLTGAIWRSPEDEKLWVELDPWKQYGTVVTLLLYLSRLLSLLALPQTLFNLAGLVLFNAFPKNVRLRGSPQFAPLLCIRVVTRGDFPELVKYNVVRNVNICRDAKLVHYRIEVVTDKPIPDLRTGKRVKQIVVPPLYVTKTGALFKARALQYCLEPGVSNLLDSDWIVHLDEETVLTENALKGILNFVFHGKHDIGQGLITYANDQVTNWLTTLADSYRVSDDMGKLRAQFYLFNKPFYALKGSYVVTNVGAERRITFDNGRDGSIAEDCFFAMRAFSEGYTFNFIEGEMWETSPITIWDFLQQRKRWIQGIYLVVHSKSIPWRSKFLLTISFYSWVTLPIITSNIILNKVVPIPCPQVLDVVCTFIGAMSVYMYIYGILKSFKLQRMGKVNLAIFLVRALLTIPFNIIIENIAVIWGLSGNKWTFYVVYKELTQQQKEQVTV